jgi:hypothetical protein
VATLLHEKTTPLGSTRDGLIKKAVCYSPRWGARTICVAEWLNGVFPM